VEPKPPASALTADPARITLERAIRAYLDEVSSYGSANTLKNYRQLMKKLTAFAADRGYALLDQFCPNDVREFRSSWSVSPQTGAKSLSTIRTFFEFCLSNEWISRNPARLVKNPRGRDAADRRNEQKLPFSDDELRSMYEACETKYGKQEVKWSREIHHHRVEGEYACYNFKWKGRDLADFISISVYTGLRISDVSTFHADRMQPTREIEIRTTKSGTRVYTWVPEWLQERIRVRAQEFGPLIFGTHRTMRRPRTPPVFPIP
jgi:integrase